MRAAANTGDLYGPWWRHNLVVFDVETTGLDDSSDRVVELGLARFEDARCVDTWGTLVYPGIEIPQEATSIHGISTADVATAPPFIRALPEIIRIARDAWPVAYNAGFDHRFWSQEMSRTAIADLQVPIFDPGFRWLDPLVWVRHVDGIWAGNKLTQVCERYGVSIVNAHRATDDAVAAGHLLTRLAERGSSGGIPPIAMHEVLRRQERMHQDQETKRRAWYAKKGIPYR